MHVVPSVPELPYLHLAANERSGAFLEWRRLKGLELLGDQVGLIAEDLGGNVAASYYREWKPEEELVRLAKVMDVGLIMMGGRRRTWVERVFDPNAAEKVLRQADRPVLVVGDRGFQGSAVPR